MQSVSADLSAAILAGQRQPLVRLRVDWGNDGDFTDTYEATVTDAPASINKALGVDPDQTTLQIGADLDHLQTLGVPVLWLVVDIAWAFPSSTTINAANATKLDACVNGAVSRGMAVALQVHGSPSWIVTSSGHTYPGNIWHGPDHATERSNWVTCLHNFLNRYSAGTIGWVEVWNEPNLAAFWNGPAGISAADYMRLLHDAYVDIKASWPLIKVVGHNISRNDIGWIQDAYAWSDIIYTAPTSAANDYWHDVVGIHPYCGTSTAGYDPSDTSHADLGGSGGGALDPDYLGYQRIYAEVVAKEGTAKPLAFGEFGYATTAGWFFVSEATRATYIAAAVALARDDNYVDYITIYYHRPTEANTSHDTSFNIHPSGGVTSTETALAAVSATSSAATTTMTLPLDDISTDVVSVDLSRELATDIPVQAKLFSGSAAAQATITLAHRDPPGDPAHHGGWFYSPLNPDSPLFGYQRKGAPVTLEFGFVTAAGTREYVTVLVGTIRSLDGVRRRPAGGHGCRRPLRDDAEADPAAHDHRRRRHRRFDDPAAQPQHHVPGRLGGPQMRLLRFAADAGGLLLLGHPARVGVARTGRHPASPRRERQRPRLLADPDVPVGGPLGAGGQHQRRRRPGADYIISTPGTLSTNNGGELLWEGWFKLNNTPPTSRCSSPTTPGPSNRTCRCSGRRAPAVQLTFRRGRADPTSPGTGGPAWPPGPPGTTRGSRSRSPPPGPMSRSDTTMPPPGR